MTTKTVCPSQSWDRYPIDPQAEAVWEWVMNEIETSVRRIGKGSSLRRDHFMPEDGWPEDPAEVADEVTNMVMSHPVIVEVIVTLHKLNRALDGGVSDV